VTQRTEIPLIGLLTLVQRALQDELHARLRARGWPEVRPSHGCVFGGMRPEGARLTDLAEQARITKQSVGEIVTDLEQLGWVERVPDPADKRAKLVRLTKRGQEVQDAARATFAEIESEWGERIGKKKVAGLRATLEELSLLPPLALPRAA
jgi:DNA-binding MarR family transcriptional regulator